jgi:pyruvate dehydrogenase E2 component (dihydrolipoamide acetyltransferase)
MTMQIKLPSLGENIESGDVLSIFVSEGDEVTVEQDLMEIETDKATMPVPSPQAGKITKVLVSEGETIAVGAPIFEIESNGEAPAKAEKKQAADEEKSAPEAKQAKPEKKAVDEEPEEEEAPAPKKRKAKPVASKDEDDEQSDEETAKPAGAFRDEPPPRPATKKMEAKVPGDAPGDGQSAAAAGPAVRRLARQLGVDLRRVRATGPGSRITAEDVQAYVRAASEHAHAQASKGVTPPGSPDSDGYGAVRVEKMSRLRQTIARNMLQSSTTAPQLTNFDDVDVTELERMRNESKDDYLKRGIKLTTMPFLVKALSASLKLHPVINASVDMENNQIIYKEYVNIGIAVDTDRGLVVPVLRDADLLSIAQIAQELDRIVAIARSATFTVDDLRGGTFTVSNLGAIGGKYSTPIINPPEVAILLIGRSQTLPVWRDSSFQPRLVMPLSLTYDHRVVDGAAAARFLNEVKGYLSAPGRLLLAP